MQRRWSISLAALTLAAGVLATAGPAAAGTGRPVPAHATVSRPAIFGEPVSFGGPVRLTPGTHPVIAHGTVMDYTNIWAGYATANGKFTTVTANWVLPAIACGNSGEDAAPWVGLDGLDSVSVEQTGTDAECYTNGKPDYVAWYEMYPNAAVFFTKVTVKAGDHFTGTVTSIGHQKYTLSLSDTTENWTKTETETAPFGAKNANAEAIVERTSSELVNFGTISFSGITVNGKPLGSYSAAPTNLVQIDMRPSKKKPLCDSASTLSGTEAFSVKWLRWC